MRIWLISGEYPPLRGGVADHTEQLAHHLAARGHQVAVITGREAGPLVGLPTSCRWSSGEPVVLPLARDWGLGVWRILRDLARTLRPDLVHLQYQAAAYGMHPAANLLPWWLARLGLPTVTTMHDLRVPYLFPKAGPLRRWAVDRLLRDSAAVVVTTPQDAAAAAPRTGPRTLLRLIPLTVQVPCCPPPDYRRAAWRARYGLDDGPTLAYFGMLNHSKGVELLFRALARVRGQGVPARLLMVGEEVGASDATNAAYRERLRRLADDLGIASALVWTGYLPPRDLSAALLAADLAALPFADGASYRRGSLLIVLAHGLPLVTTDGPASVLPAGAQDALPVLRDGEHCLLVPPGNADALAGAVLRLWRDPDLRTRLSAGARRLAATFSWDQVAPATLDLYTTVLARWRATGPTRGGGPGG